MNSVQFFIFPLFILFLLSAAQAETINEKAEVINDQTEWRLRDKANQQALDKRLQQSNPPIQLPKAEALPSPKQEAIFFVINTIEAEGLLSNWVKQQGEIYIGQCVGMQSIQAYIRLINKNLLARGYITSRAVLPEQNLASKVLTIKIIEGTIESIEFPSNYRVIWSHALPLKIGNVLNLRDMEQAVDQLNRLQSQNIEFKIKPGLESNGSILVAEVKESKRWYISASIDNSGSTSTGKKPVSISAMPIV